jgi:hypothetical protein
MQYGLELRTLLGRQQRAFAGPRVLEGRRRVRRGLGASSIHDGEEQLPEADTLYNRLRGENIRYWGCNLTREWWFMGDDEAACGAGACLSWRLNERPAPRAVGLT